jgi:transcription termination factor NusB
MGDIASEYGVNQMPATDLLSGREYTLNFEDGSAVNYEFVDSETLEWSVTDGRQDGASGRTAYTATTPREDIYLVDYMRDDEPRTSVSLVLDLDRGVATSVTASIPGAASEMPQLLLENAMAGESLSAGDASIAGIQDDTANAVETIEESNEQIERGIEMVEEAIEVLEEIHDAVEEVNDGIQEVAEATDAVPLAHAGGTPWPRLQLIETVLLARSAHESVRTGAASRAVIRDALETTKRIVTNYTPDERSSLHPRGSLHRLATGRAAFVQQGTWLAGSERSTDPSGLMVFVEKPRSVWFSRFSTRSRASRPRQSS